MPYISVNDIKLYHEVSGSGEPLILLHGAQGDSSSFHMLARRLSDNFTVINFDQRGSGKSDKPDMQYTMALIADDTAELITNLGYESVHVFGVSLGGMVAQSLSIKYPHLVKTLTLGCTLPGGWSRAIKKEVPADAGIAFSSDDQISEAQRAKALANISYGPGYIERNPEIVNQLIKIRKDNPIDKVGFSRRLEMTGLYDGYDDLNKIQCPCLVVAGKHDQLLDYKNSYLIADAIPNADIVILEHAGHVFWDEELELFIEIYQQFLETH